MEWQPEIKAYIEAYKALHGETPEIERRGSWLSIGGGVFAIKVRRSDIPAMTSQLLYLLNSTPHQSKGRQAVGIDHFDHVNLDAARAVANCSPLSDALPGYIHSMADEIEHLRAELDLANAMIEAVKQAAPARPGVLRRALELRNATINK